MVWATVSSRSFLCWLHGASPSSAAKNIIHLILVLTIWWYACVELSLVLLVKGVCYDQCVLFAKLCWPLPCFILYSKAKLACDSRYLLTSWLPTFAFQSSMMKRTSFFLVSVLEGLVGLHRTIQIHLLRHSCWGTDLDYYDIEWSALETNRDHSVIFETAPKYCIWGSCWL